MNVELNFRCGTEALTEIEKLCWEFPNYRAAVVGPTCRQVLDAILDGIAYSRVENVNRLVGCITLKNGSQVFAFDERNVSTFIRGFTFDAVCFNEAIDDAAKMLIVSRTYFTSNTHVYQFSSWE